MVQFWDELMKRLKNSAKLERKLYKKIRIFVSKHIFFWNLQHKIEDWFFITTQSVIDLN